MCKKIFLKRTDPVINCSDYVKSSPSSRTYFIFHCSKEQISNSYFNYTLKLPFSFEKEESATDIHLLHSLFKAASDIKLQIINSGMLKSHHKHECLYHKMIWIGWDLKVYQVPTPCHGQGCHLLVSYSFPGPHSTWSRTPPGMIHPELLWAALLMPHRPLSKGFPRTEMSLYWYPTQPLFTFYENTVVMLFRYHTSNLKITSKPGGMSQKLCL